VKHNKDGVEQTVRGEFLHEEGRDARERPLGFVPTQPDLRLSFPDFFATPGAVAVAAALASGHATAPTREPDMEAVPGQLSGALLRPLLMRLDGTGMGELFSLERNDVVLGRGVECEIKVDNASVSQEHAAIFRSDGVWRVKDLSSSNGTLLDDRRLHGSQQLRDGAVICLAPGVSFVFQRVNARHEAVLRLLVEGSYRDPLTGVRSRRYVEERLCAEVAFAVRHQRPLSLVLFGVDEFRHKHFKTGDAVLRQVAERILPLLRTEDVFGRHGSDKFALVLRETESLTAGAIAERLRNAVQAPGDALGISAGCAALDECEEPNAVSLTALARQRLVEASARGGSRVVIQ